MIEVRRTRSDRRGTCWDAAVQFHGNRHAAAQKKADVAEHPKVFDHVGLLVNEPSSQAEVLFI
jgi:hypothetical protein